MNSTKNDQKMARREKIIKLIKLGISIPKISERLGVGKSTIYYHYKKIKGKKYQLVRIPNDEEIIGEFLGVFAGDGSFFYDKKLGHYTISIHLHAIDDKEYGFYLKRLIENNFNKKVRIYFKPKKELLLVFYSKDIFSLIKNYLIVEPSKTLNISIRKPIKQLSRGFLRYFIRGLIDTDGHVQKSGRIILALVSKNMVTQTSNMLKEVEIVSNISQRKREPPEHTLYELTIPSKYGKKYSKIIGFSNKRKEKNAAAEIRNPDSFQNSRVRA